MALQILKFPNPILKLKASPVDVSEGISKELHDLAYEMKHTLEVSRGVGLAAPQVGHSIRMVVCLLDCGLTYMINPQIRPVTTTMIPEHGFGEGYEYVTEIREGCLSLPLVYSPVKRFKHIEVTYTDLEGKTNKAYFQDKDSVIIQHECDHLDGTLFIDRLGAARSMLLQKYFKKNRK